MIVWETSEWLCKLYMELARGDLNGWPWDELRPDGDVEIAEEIVDKFRLIDAP